MSKVFWQEGKRKHATFEGQRKASVTGVEKTKSNTKWDEAREAGKSQATQGGNVSTNLGSVLGTEQPSKACKEYSPERS